MTTTPTPEPAATLPERFAALIAPRTPKHQRDNDDFMAYMYRMLRAMEARAIADPAMLAHWAKFVDRVHEIPNVAIAVNAARYAIDERSGASRNECAQAMGISGPAASKRRARGIIAMGTRIDQAGAARFSEAKRERELIDKANQIAEVELEEYRGRHLRIVA